MYRWPTKEIKPFRPGPRIIRAGIWTVHFGIDDEGRDSQRRMRDIVRYVYYERSAAPAEADGSVLGIWSWMS